VLPVLATSPLSAKRASFAVASGTLVMLASAVATQCSEILPKA